MGGYGCRRTRKNRIDPRPPPDYSKPMKVSAQYAEEHFADIAHTAMRGEVVVIAFPDDAALSVTLLKPAATTVPRRPRGELWGAGEGLVKSPTQEEWDRIHQQFLDEMPDFAPVGGERA